MDLWTILAALLGLAAIGGVIAVHAMQTKATKDKADLLRQVDRMRDDQRQLGESWRLRLQRVEDTHRQLSDGWRLTEQRYKSELAIREASERKLADEVRRLRETSFAEEQTQKQGEWQTRLRHLALSKLGFQADEKPSLEEIKREWQKRIFEFHPDRYQGDREIATRLTQELLEARKIIGF